MAANSIKINQDNFYEWLCSIGYLLPRNDIELQRFEKLQPPGSIVVNETAIDPFAIINKTRVRSLLSFSVQALPSDEQEQLRMAARKHSNLPKDIMDQIFRNQQKKRDGTDNKSENTGGDN